MKIGVILPHTLLFGGVKHHLEIGETCIARGHTYTVFTPEGTPPDWFPFSGRVLPLSAFHEHRFDVVITSEEMFLDHLVSSGARVKIFNIINENHALRRIARHSDVIIVANSTHSFRRVKHTIGRTPFKAFGGINTDDYFPHTRSIPERPFVVITYGRQSMRRKGTDLVKAACERLHRKGYDIRLLLFDTLVGADVERDYRSFTSTCPYEFVVNHPIRRNHELYHRAHVFASAERKGAWANTAAEAMACGIPVVASGVGSEDFLLPGRTGLRARRTTRSVESAIARLHRDPALRERLARTGARRITHYQWRIMADQLLSLCEREDAHAVAHLEWPYTVNRIKSIHIRPSSRRGQGEALPPGVYVVNYHAIVDPQTCHPWERGLTEFSTRIDRFKSHMEWLRAHATMVALTELPALLAGGPLERACAAMTFDDGFRSVRSAALPVLRRMGITATAFVNSSFADGAVPPTILIAEIIRTGDFAAFARELRRRFGVVARKPKHLYRALKGAEDHAAIVEWIRAWGHDAVTGPVHLSWDDMRALVTEGWTIGNHTATHALLAALNLKEQAAEIEGMVDACARHGIPLVPWLAYPFGSSEHVNAATLSWMSEHRDWFGVFCNGGVNVAPSRTEVLRIGVADPDLEEFVSTLMTAARVMERLQGPVVERRGHGMRLALPAGTLEPDRAGNGSVKPLHRE